MKGDMTMNKKVILFFFNLIFINSAYCMEKKEVTLSRHVATVVLGGVLIGAGYAFQAPLCTATGIAFTLGGIDGYKTQTTIDKRKEKLFKKQLSKTN